MSKRPFTTCELARFLTKSGSASHLTGGRVPRGEKTGEGAEVIGPAKQHSCLVGLCWTCQGQMCGIIWGSGFSQSPWGSCFAERSRRSEERRRRRRPGDDHLVSY